MNNTLENVIYEVEKAVVGKREVVEKILMALLSSGHVLLDDVPGVGKTTIARAISQALGLNYRRVQFTPDVLPSDIVGFSMYDRESGTFRYVSGTVNDTNLLLGDEINRTSSKTQSALLEAMEENQVTVDGVCHPLSDPFCVIATQNQVGTAGTQPLPQAQMDRFLVRLTIGYPDFESQMEILRDRQVADPIDSVKQVADKNSVLKMRDEVRSVSVSDEILAYITRLSIASREHPMLTLGLSPRGALGVNRMAKAKAYMDGRDFVIPEDVQAIFSDVCAHRVIIGQAAKTQKLTAPDIMAELLSSVPLPHRKK
jgi:MoxR-like ATPase